VISATHRNLQAEIRAGKFREDLFYRFRVVTIDLPAAAGSQRRYCVADGDFFANAWCAAGADRGLKRDAMATIEKYELAGNVRELKNVLERSLVLLARRNRRRRFPARWCTAVELAEASRDEHDRNGNGIFASRSEV